MTDELDPALAALDGETIHVLDQAGINVQLQPASEEYEYPTTVTLLRGQELVLTEPILRASLNRRGQSWLLANDLSAEPRWGFGEYPETERLYDFAHMPDESRLVQASTVVANYAGDRGDRDVRLGGLRPGLRAQ